MATITQLDRVTGFYPVSRGFESLSSHQIRLGSLMVKQATHNRSSGSSILSQGTNFIPA